MATTTRTANRPTLATGGTVSTRRPTREEIQRRAYELFEKRGYESGHEWEDWFTAEKTLMVRTNTELKR